MVYCLPLPHSVSIEPKSSNSADGEPTFGTAVTEKCRFEHKTTYARGDRGEELIYDARLTFLSTSSVAYGDRITFGAYIGTVESVDPQYDTNGNVLKILVFLQSK